MRPIICRLFCCTILLALAVTDPVHAQYAKYRASDPATGEVYRVEFGIGLWSPTPEMQVSSQSLGIIGTEIDAVADLGVEKTTFKEFRLVLRPARKHRFRIAYLPIEYTAETVLKRTIVFNGQTYNIGLPVNSSLDWKAWRFGYEYDFIYRDRGFVGVILEAKYTDVSINLDSPLTKEWARARAPIPTIGGIVRVYPAANIAITAEVTGFQLPEDIDKQERYSGRYIDVDVYGTVNFTNNVGVQAGYRSLSVGYRAEQDRGNIVLKGLYVMGVARF